VRRFTGAVAAAIVAAVSLTGCNVIPDLRTLVHSDRIPARELDQIIEQTDSPDGTDFNYDMRTSRVADNAQDAEGLWNSYGGTPQYCLEAFEISFLASGVDADSGGTYVSIGRFNYPYEREGLLIVNARTFADATAASGYLDQATAAGDACPDGYQLTDVGDSGWRVEQVTTTDASATLNLSEAVRGLYHDELTAESVVLYRDILIQYKNVVAEVSCEIHPESPFSLSSCDTIAESMAKRLTTLG
jgi:hypothetical protein